MSGIEIGLVVCVGLMIIAMFVATWWVHKLYLRIQEEDTFRLNVSRDYRASVLDDIYKLKEGLKEVKLHLGFVDKQFPFREYPVYRKPAKSVHQRINFLMDHLNLEVKDSEPSQTTLVKKKPIKRGK